MSSFAVSIYKIASIDNHPNADRLEIVKIKGYDVIVPKCVYSVGDLIGYIPEAAIVPDWIISELGLVGALSGPEKNRVKTIRLRGVLSQGLVYPTQFSEDLNRHYIADPSDNVLYVQEDDDVTEFLGITKYIPPIPIGMAGDVFNARGYTPNYDIENLKNFPHVLEYGENVVVTEKIHGTFIAFGYHPELDSDELVNKNIIVASKGVSAQGLAFKGNANNANNLYVRAASSVDDDGNTLIDRTLQFASSQQTIIPSSTPFFYMGELFGPVQDLKYGLSTATLRIFDIYVGPIGFGRFLNYEEMLVLSKHLNFNTVPELYTGPYSTDVVNEYTSGTESVSGTEAHIREGIVIKPMVERKDMKLGRVILKSISGDYLTRRGKKGQETTEYN